MPGMAPCDDLSALPAQAALAVGNHEGAAVSGATSLEDRAVLPRLSEQAFDVAGHLIRGPVHARRADHPYRPVGAQHVADRQDRRGVECALQRAAGVGDRGVADAEVGEQRQRVGRPVLHVDPDHRDRTGPAAYWASTEIS